MTRPPERPDVNRRLAAIVAIVLVTLVVIATFVAVVGDFPRLVAQLVLLAAAALAAWYGLTRVGGRRAIAVLVAIAALTGIVLVGYAEAGGGPVSLLVRVIPLLLAVSLSRFALGRNVRALKEGETPGIPAQAATHGVLIMNLKSGGGKAERFHLVEECRKRGIEPVVLQPGEDLLELARGAVDRGADVIGMAGGDGSQALVASVAAERGVPMVVVPAGTRNHLALDLGLDRDDVVGALDAFGEARSVRWISARSTGMSSSTTSRSASTPRSSVRRSTATPRSTPPLRRCRGCSHPAPNRSTSGSRGRTVSLIEART